MRYGRKGGKGIGVDLIKTLYKDMKFSSNFKSKIKYSILYVS